MFTCLDRTNVNTGKSGRERRKGSFDKCVMGKGLIRQEAASFDFTSETGSVGKDTAGGEGDMIGLHWTVTTRWLQACCYSAARSFFYFCLNKKKKRRRGFKGRSVCRHHLDAPDAETRRQRDGDELNLLPSQSDNRLQSALCLFLLSRYLLSHKGKMWQQPCFHFRASSDAITA